MKNDFEDYCIEKSYQENNLLKEIIRIPSVKTYEKFL